MIICRFVSFKETASFKARQQGFSLIELLISLVIFTVSFLGLASLQQLSLQLTHDASLNNRAMQLSQNLIEQMRSHGNDVSIKDWQDEVASSLPKGQASISVDSGEYTLELTWQESAHSQSVENKQQFQTSFILNFH